MALVFKLKGVLSKSAYTYGLAKQTSIKAIKVNQFTKKTLTPHFNFKKSMKYYCSPTPKKHSYQRAYAAELYWQIRRGQHFILIDVRKQIEFAVQRISGSFNVPIDKLDASRFDTLPKDKSIVLFGKEDLVGVIQVADMLSSLGYKNISIVEGGPQEFIDNNFMYTHATDLHDSIIALYKDIEKWEKVVEEKEKARK